MNVIVGRVINYKVSKVSKVLHFINIFGLEVIINSHEMKSLYAVELTFLFLIFYLFFNYILQMILSFFYSFNFV